MRRSPTSAWRRSIPSTRNPSEPGNWASNLPMAAVAVVDMAAVATAVAAVMVVAAAMVAVVMVAAAMAAVGTVVAAMVAAAAAAAAGIEGVAAAVAASAGAAATAAAVAACRGVAAGRPARFRQLNRLADALSPRPGPITSDPAFARQLAGHSNAISRGRQFSRSHCRHHRIAAGCRTACLCLGSWRSKPGEPRLLRRCESLRCVLIHDQR